MNNSRHEYLETHPDNERKFSIAKAPPDPETLAIFEARRLCREEPRRKIDRAKYLFDELCDRATNTRGPGFVRKGSVIVPDSEFARMFGVWESTITVWKKTLVALGYIWISKQKRSDRWPITVYHLACIHPRPNHATQNPDGTSNFGGGRAAPGKPGEPTGNFDPKTGNAKVWSHGARKPGQKSLPLATPHVPPVPWNTPRPEPPKLKNKAILAAIMDLDWLSATEDTGSQPVSAPAVSHGAHRLSAGAGNGAQPVPNGADSQQKNGATAGARQTLKRVSVGSVENLKKGEGGTPPPDLGIGDFKKQWRGSYQRERTPILAKLRSDMAQAADADKPWFQERIDFLKWMDTGGKPPGAKRIVAHNANVTTAKPEKLDALEAELAAGYARQLKVKVAA